MGGTTAEGRAREGRREENEDGFANSTLSHLVLTSLSAIGPLETTVDVRTEMKERTTVLGGVGESEERVRIVEEGVEVKEKRGG